MRVVRIFLIHLLIQLAELHFELVPKPGKLAKSIKKENLR